MIDRYFELRYTVNDIPATEAWHEARDSTSGECYRHTERQWRRLQRRQPNAVFVGLIYTMPDLA